MQRSWGGGEGLYHRCGQCTTLAYLGFSPTSLLFAGNRSVLVCSPIYIVSVTFFESGGTQGQGSAE